MNGTESQELWTLGRFIETAEAYSFHTLAADVKQELYDGAGRPAAAADVLEQIAEHKRQLAELEAKLRRYVTKFPALRNHWAVAEHELNFLDP